MLIAPFWWCASKVARSASFMSSTTWISTLVDLITKCAETAIMIEPRLACRRRSSLPRSARRSVLESPCRSPLRRSLRAVIPADEAKPWMRYAGMVESGGSSIELRTSTTYSMVERTEVYVDTSALIAFLDRSDTHHCPLSSLSRTVRNLHDDAGDRRGHAWFLRRYDRFRALQFLAMIEDLEPLKVVQVGSAEQAGATQLRPRFSDQDLTLTDAVGLHAMQQIRVRTCWSTDFHLWADGRKARRQRT